MIIEKAEVTVWQDMFTSIIEDADSNILILDEEFRVLILNSGFYWIFLETYGIDLKKGSSLIESMANVNPHLTWIWKERCITALSGTPIKVEDSFDVEGRTYYWEIHFKSVTRPDSTQVISVFSRDITIRKAYQKKILQNEANVRSILNTIEDSICLVDACFELIDFNREFYKRHKHAFGIRPSRGKNILSLLPESRPEVREQWRLRFEETLKGKPGRFVDHHVFDKEQRAFEVRIYPIVEDGNV
ncbi:MAG TPA: hypothetical protein VEB86_15930, partial [Chryseosolibacter sp.]|nr:hypothetical protein [Chryseosolibacter sp.]